MGTSGTDQLMSPLDHSLAGLSHEPLSDGDIRRMRWYWLDGLFSNCSLNFYNSFIGLFAAACGANNVQVGQVTAVASLCGVIALVPGARAIQMAGGRRKTVVIVFTGLVARLPILAWILAPFLLTTAGLSGSVIAIIIAANAIITFGTNLAYPAWSAMAADIVPHDIRGRYFGHRNLWINLAGLIILPLAGWLVETINGPNRPVAGYQAIFALALLTGLAATAAYARIDDSQLSHAGRRPVRLAEVGRMLRDAPGFLGLVGCTLLWNLGLQLCSPFMNLYLVRDLGADTTMVGWVTAASSLASIVGARRMGRMADVRGNIWMQGLTSFLIPITPLLWMVAQHAWQVILINTFGGLLWTAYNLASFNLMLEMTPEGARAEATALFQFVVAASAVIAPMAGGYLADAHGYRLTMAASAAVRWAAAGAFVWWVARPALRRAGSAKGKVILPPST